MLIEFIAKNFRSIKDQVILSFESNSSKQRSENTFSVSYGNKEDKLSLIKSIAIYGSNASGKSNIIKAFSALRYLIRKSYKNEVGENIICYEPFTLDPTTKNAPAYFELSFIMPIIDGANSSQVKYKYIVEFNRTKITDERLYVYNTTRETLLFSRDNTEQQFHTIDFKRGLNVEGAKREILENQLFLSKFNTDTHSVLTPICSYIKNIDIEIADGLPRTKIINDQIAKDIMLDTTNILKDKLIRLTEVADISIKDILIKERDESEFRFPESFPDNLKKHIIKDNKFAINFIHPSFSNGVEISATAISIEEQSLGTQVLFGLGARILKALDSGGILFYDEFNSSLHPFLSKFLVSLFNSNISNPKNAQLVITTHEPSIIERGQLRSDQIWFVEKNKYGFSELFSAQDFEGVREDIPFDKWYESGRFGATPDIGDITHIFGNPTNAE